MSNFIKHTIGVRIINLTEFIKAAFVCIHLTPFIRTLSGIQQGLVNDSLIQLLESQV